MIFCFSLFYWGLSAQSFGPGNYSIDLTVNSNQTATITVQGWAGGGGGGTSAGAGDKRKAGGGGGGYFTDIYTLGPGTYTIAGVVGSGGGQGVPGENTTFNLTGPGTNISVVLGGGGEGTNQGGAGGSGPEPGGDGGDRAPGNDEGGGGGGGSGLGATDGVIGALVTGGSGGEPGGGAGGDLGVDGEDATGPGGGGGGRGTGSGTVSGSGGDGQISIEIVLPVELSRFEANPKDNMVELEWTTVSEINNDFFQIEHSADGVNFISVGKIKGNGTTSETVDYEFMHRQPNTGINYYRLKQVDFDGAFEYSPMVVINLNDRSSGVNLYPNPTLDRVMVTLGNRPEKVKITLTNLLGQGIDLQPVSTANGWEIDLSDLGQGVYILRAEYDGKTETRQIIKK